MLSMIALVTFLGRAQPENPSGYRPATYSFPEGNRTTTFIGFELARFLKPGRVVILGTDASMWDHLVEKLADHEPGKLADSDEVFRARLALIDDVKQQRVSPDTLEKVRPILEDRFQCEVLPRLIPYGRTPEEQEQILQTIAEAVPNGQVHFDVTHGFRHLSMVAFTAAFMLGHIRKITVRSLWYGALDMSSGGVTPVLRLDGLNQVHQWTLALAQYEASGDYSVFADLLERGGFPPPAAAQLRQAAYFERINNIPEAAGKLRQAMQCLEQSLQGPAEMFRPALLARLQWARQGGLDGQQRCLAWDYLNRGDLPRAAVFAFEAVLSHLCIALKLDSRNYRVREEAWRQLAEKIRRGEFVGKVESVAADLKALRAIRNSIAHGIPSEDSEIDAFLRTHGKLAAELRRIFDCALGSPGNEWPW